MTAAFTFRLLDPATSVATGTHGIDTLDVIQGTNGNDTLDGTSGDDTITGLKGDDVLSGLDGNDSIDGGVGNDSLLGGDGNDTIIGGVGIDTIDGGTGDDLLYGGKIGSPDRAGNTIDGGLGNDTIYGGRANDLIDGGSGNDVIHYDGGVDTVHGSDGDDYITSEDPALKTGHPLINGALFGDDGNDTLISSTFDGVVSFVSTLDGGGGDDTISITGGAGFGDWLLLGGDGRDTLSVGGSGSDTLNGGDGNDTLSSVGSGTNQLNGEAGKDHLFAGLGGDTLSGGADADKLTGGKGADVFLYTSITDSAPGAEDFIKHLHSNDAIDLSAIDADTTQDGNQAFTLVSSFDDHAGELRLVYNSGLNQTFVEGDIDGDGQADFRIAIQGDHSDFTNFVL